MKSSGLHTLTKGIFHLFSNFEDLFFAMNHARLQAVLVQLARTNAPCFEDVALQGFFLSLGTPDLLCSKVMQSKHTHTYFEDLLRPHIMKQSMDSLAHMCMQHYTLVVSFVFSYSNYTIRAKDRLRTP